MSTQLLLSAKKKARNRRDDKIRANYSDLHGRPGSNTTTIREQLMKKYKLSQSTIRAICQPQATGSQNEGE